MWCAFLIFVLSVPKYHISGVLAFAAFPIVVVLSGRLPVLAIAKKVVLLSPFVLVMAAANPFLDRAPLLTAGGFLLSAGMVSAAVIVAKGILSILVVLTLVYYVPFYEICTALRSLRVPEVFVTQMVLLYRYSHLLAEEATALQKARNMRAFGWRGKGPLVTAKLIGTLLLRTVERADRIYRAMVARGFNGTVHHSPAGQFQTRDAVFIAAAVLFFVAIRTFI